MTSNSPHFRWERYWYYFDFVAQSAFWQKDVTLQCSSFQVQVQVCVCVCACVCVCVCVRVRAQGNSANTDYGILGQTLPCSHPKNCHVFKLGRRLIL